MIYCPKCGTANREGSRFCNECGALLPSGEELRCPMCGEMNPAGSVHCRKCNARLIPLISSQPPEEEGPKLSPPPPVEGAPAPAAPFGTGPPSRPEAPTGGEDWLRELRAAASGTEEEAEPAAEEIEPVEIPDWLTGLEAAPPEETPAAEAPPLPFEEQPEEEEIEPVEIPDWLTGLEAAPPEEPPTGEAPPPPFEEQPEEEIEPVEIPDWLTGLEVVPPEEPPTGEAPPPPFLATAEEAPPEEPSKAPVFLSEEELPPAGAEETMPEWLAELAPSEGKAPAEAAAPPLPPQTEPLAAPPEVEGLVPAEIPDWLQALRPRPEAEAAPEEPVETEGLLEGLRGTLPSSPAVEMPEEVAPAAPTAPSAAAVTRAELLQELLSRPITPPPPKKERPREMGWAIQRTVVAVLLLLAIIAPILVPIPLFALPAAPAAERSFAAVEQAVKPDTPVLVAFEYGPAEADEMDRVAEPILRHLLDRGARLVIVSTRPEGPAVAEGLLARLRPEAQRVANLGYQPGQVAGVQELLTSLDQRVEVSTGLPAAQVEAMKGVHTAADVGMVVVLAAQPDELRAWVEQASLAYPDLPVVAGISARAEPLTAPYADPAARQLRGMVAGLVGATAYERHLLETGGRAAFYLNSLGVAQLLVVGLMLGGAVVFLLGGRK